MADPLTDPFGTPDLAINPNPDPSTVTRLKGQWDSFLADPKGVAALASFGMAMMQPVGLGQSAMGHFGQAMGNAGEAVRSIEKQDVVQQAADTKTQDAEARMADRERRAGIAEAGLGLRREGLGLQQLRFGLQKDVAEQKLGIQNQLLEIRRQRGEARTDYERQRLDQQERDMQRRLDQLDLNRANVESQVATREQRTQLQSDLNDIRRERSASTDENRKSQLDIQERDLQRKMQQLELNRGDVRRTGEVTERQGATIAAQQTRDLSKLATDQATDTYQRLQPDPLMPVSRQPAIVEADKQFVGKTPTQIRDMLLNDKSWRASQAGRGSAPTPAGGSAVPAADPDEGRTATGPNGERVIRRNGQWVPL